MPTVTVGRLRLYYERAGTGEPVMFISGLGADHNLWYPIVERLKGRYECIIFDNRGIGQSSKPRIGYTMDDLTRDTLGLLDKLSLSKVHVVGMSMGGMVALNMALERPAVVSSMVLSGSMAAPDPRLMLVLNSRKVMQRRMKRSEYFRALAPWMFGPDTLGRPGFLESFVRERSENPYPQRLQAFGQLVDGIGAFDVRASLGRIRVPTLVLVGEQDILTPPHLSRALAQGIPGAELVVLPGLSHFCASEDPDRFAEQLLRFFGGGALRA
ncbi:MAG: alpha/beta fold hydrolase [Dehalococcoidia bacterium]